MPIIQEPLVHKEVQNMNKYEIALVVSTRIEDDAREAVLEKVKDLVAKVGGNITNIDD